jgi:succinate dehydrogenase / fumarate reductase membrane anchor subunit
MVEPATPLGRSGLQDWLIQCISAVILAIYTAFLVVYFVTHPVLQYEQWHMLFECRVMKYASALVLLSLISHAWIGIWTVITDYIKPHVLRLSVEISFIIALFVCLMWGIRIIWSI